MHKYLVYAAYGWLTLGGTLHFVIDVVSQYLRGKRVPGPETTLYYGLNSAYALGQFLLGVVGLLMARESLSLVSQWPMVSISLGAGLCWLVIGFMFLEYWEPRVVTLIFIILVIAAAATA
jgi:hypothetical protein